MQPQSTVQRKFILIALVQMEKSDGTIKHTPMASARGLGTHLLVATVTLIWQPLLVLTHGN